MTAPRLPRRLVVGLTSAALLGGVVGVVPLLSSASAACPATYKDAAGDAVLIADGLAVPEGPDLGNDPDLDILDVTHTVDAGVFSTIIHFAELKDFGPQVSYTERDVAAFTVNGKAVEIEAERDHYVDPEGDTGTLTVAGTATTVPVKVLVDLKASTVTSQIAVPAFETALGGSLSGKAFSAMSATAKQVFVSPVGGPSYSNPQDTATAPATASYAFGSSCSGGGGTPAPTGTGSPSPSPSPTTTTPPPAAGTLFDQPRKNCVSFKDATGDAQPDPLGADQEDALDINQVNLKSPTGQLQVYVGIVDPSSALFPLFSGPLYTTSFTIGGKTVALTAGETGPATATVGGAANSDIKATAKVDAAKKNVVFTVPLDGLSKATATAVKAGTAITGTTATTAADSDLGPLEADSATGTTAAEKTYAYGDNTCFLPPPGVITLDADPSGQYSDVTELFATLNDADGSPVQNASVTAVLTGGKAVTAKTDDDGIADLKLPLLVPAGAKTITVAFAGDGEVGPAKATKAFTVALEKTLLKAVASRGGATATVVDNDKHPVVGRYVTFTIGSTKRLVKTNTRGVAVLTGVRKGTAVKVAFLPVKGFYLGTPTITVKAL
jgi:hypothetical protein